MVDPDVSAIRFHARLATGSSGDVPTVLVRDSEGKDLLCFLEQLIPLDGQDMRC